MMSIDVLLQEKRQKHVPERSCVACRSRRPQWELTRLTCIAGVWKLSRGARKGRGVYICTDDQSCWQVKKLRRTFRQQAERIATLFVSTSSSE